MKQSSAASPKLRTASSIPSDLDGDHGTGVGVSVRSTHTLIARLASMGVDIPALVASVGLRPEDLRDPDGRISHARAAALWNRARDLSGDPLLSIRALEVVHALHVELLPDVTEYLMIQLVASSSDVREAFSRLARYYAIVDDGTRVTVESGPGRSVTLAFGFPPEARDCRLLVEFSIGIWARVLRGALEDATIPLEVHLRAPAPATDVREVERTVGATLRYGAERDGISIDARQLRAQLRSARPALSEHLERRAIEAIARLSTGASLARKVRSALREGLRHGSPTAEQTAKQLRTSVRTLSRRLREEGTSHGALLDEVRAELAARYLGDPDLGGADVASLLGFSDATTFHRAFRRWYGCTPAEFRARSAQRS
jgi:AraC-like DNA-binding protein